MKVSHAKIYQCISFFLILSVFVTTLTSCNNGNFKTAVVQKTELTLTQLVATQELNLASPKEMATEMPTITLTPEPTATETEMPTPTEVEVLEDRHIFLTEKIGYGDYQFDFEISLLNDDYIIKASFERFGIKSISINEEKIGARELLAKGIIYSFVETYNIQNGTNVSMEEYMANPTNYPTKIKMLGEDSKQEIQAVTIDKIKKIELRYTGGMDGELYMPYGPTYSGYRLEDETFIIYTFFGIKNPELLQIIERENELEDYELPSYYGLYAISYYLYSGLASMQLTTVPAAERPMERSIEVFNNTRIVMDAKSLSPLEGEEFKTWVRKHGSLFVVYKE